MTPAFATPALPLSSSTSFTTPLRTCRPRRSAAAPVAVMGFPSTSTYATGASSKVTIKVLQKDRCTVVEVEKDENLRKALLAAKVDIYTLGGKMRNCGGGGSCGTCIVAVEDGFNSMNGRSAKEEVLLEGKPANFRLACRTMIHGDITVSTKPKG